MAIFPHPVLTLTLALGLACASAGAADTQELRGYGSVHSASSTVDKLDLRSFACENPERALRLMHKLASDLAQSATVAVRWVPVRVGGVEAPVLVRDGLGSFLPAVAGSTVLLFTSPVTDDLASAFAATAPRLAGARFFDKSYAYPVHLDKFAKAGIGSWYPYAWGGESTKDKPNTVDDHFDFLRKHGLALQPIGADFTLRNLLPKLHEYGVPYHLCQWMEWNQDLARMAPEELVTPGDSFTTMPHYYGQISDGARKLPQYRNWSFQNLVKKLVGDPQLVDWCDPNGEVGPMPIYYYWDFSERNRLNLVRYLSEQRHYTPQSLGVAWYGDGSRFASWDQVRIPIGYDVFGWRAGDPLAAKSWRIHPASELKPGAAFTDWSKLVNDCPPYIRNGLALGYQRSDFNDAGWAETLRPGGELASISWNTGATWNTKFYWRRGAIDTASGWIDAARASGRIYLTVAALNQSSGWKAPDRLWFNGQELAAMSAAPGSYIVTQLDVTDLVKPGRNSVVQLGNVGLYGTDGPFFLTTRKLESFPFSDPQLNVRYLDWRHYVSWCVTAKMEDTYQAIRAVDPERSIKMMAAADMDLCIPLAAKYGCYPHSTGEGGFLQPWNKRTGYPYDLPSSAEFGSSVTEPAAFKRWIGFFLFEGNNAFDNFLPLQDLMHSPVKDLWAEYLPYLKLAPRYDLRKPGLALMRSTPNLHLLPRGVPYCFDLGRGDLQSIGRSCVYVDEQGLRNGVAQSYPVIWDTGTNLMDATTVADLKRYVEDGGTYVALQETGRHSYLKRDVWPISELTGFKVREVRQMVGTVAILADQPLFKKLAGRNFYNRGKSIDYSDYNFADACVALDPVAADTIPIARYDDGAIAIGMRKLGKGRVIVLGSPFWRDSCDRAGMWWPGEGQSDFLEDLLDSLGVPVVAHADTREIWRESYLANNGSEEFLVLFNPNDTAKTASLTWHTALPAATLFDPKTGAQVAGTVDGMTVKLDQLTLAALETRVIATQPRRSPAEALDACYAHLVRWSHPSAPGTMLTRPDLPSYTVQLASGMSGRIVAAPELAKLDPAALSTRASPGEGFVHWAGQSLEEWRGKPDPARRIVLHRAIELPAKWTRNDAIELVVSSFHHRIPGDPVGPVDVYVNGAKLIDQKSCLADGDNELADGLVVELGSRLAYDGKNAICLVAGPNGFMGEIKLRRRPAVAQSIEVTGACSVQLDADAGVGQATLPGPITGLYAWKDDVAIPASWSGSRIFIDINVDNLADFDACAINDKVIFHPTNWNRPVTWMDVTPWVKCGQANRLTLISRPATKSWLPGTPVFKAIRFQRVAAGVP